MISNIIDVFTQLFIICMEHSERTRFGKSERSYCKFVSFDQLIESLFQIFIGILIVGILYMLIAFATNMMVASSRRLLLRWNIKSIDLEPFYSVAVNKIFGISKK